MLLIAAAVAACATTQPATAYRPRNPEYSFGFYNATDRKIRECKIRWNDAGTPRESGSGALSARVSGKTYFEPDPIPQKVKLSWTTSDGKHHQRELEVAKTVPDLKKFSGTIWFRIGQDDKDVKVIARRYDEERQMAIEQKPYWPK